MLEACGSSSGQLILTTNEPAEVRSGAVGNLLLHTRLSVAFRIDVVSVQPSVLSRLGVVCSGSAVIRPWREKNNMREMMLRQERLHFYEQVPARYCFCMVLGSVLVCTLVIRMSTCNATDKPTFN